MDEVFKRFLELTGVSVEIRRKQYYWSDASNLQASINDQGGEIADGTYYYRVNPVTANGEQPAPGSLKVEVSTGTNSSTVTLTMPSYPNVQSWRIYRSTSKFFDDPSFIGSTDADTFTDTLASPQPGKPPSTYGDPIELWNSQSTKARLAREKFISKIKYEKLERIVGWEIVNSYWMIVSSDVDIQANDYVLFKNDFYEVTVVFPFYWRGTEIGKRATIEQRQPE